MTKLIAAVAIITAALAACADPGQSKVDKWEQWCSAQGGYLSVVDMSFWSTEYRCIIDNVPHYVPQNI